LVTSAGVGEDRVEHATELAAAVADEEPDLVCTVDEVHQEVSGRCAV
jgi:hypothetical protein